ncbi:hypothetical protein [Paraburkholderia terrae]
MQTDHYKGFALWGHAIEQPPDMHEHPLFAASGTVTRAGKLIAASGVLGVLDDEDAAQQLGLESAHAWVDSHG